MIRRDPEPAAPVEEIVVVDDRRVPAGESESRRPRIDRRSARRIGAAAVGILILLAGGYFIPIPGIGEVRDWADSVGPAFVVLFFAASAIITLFPFPRSTFTVMSGLLFGPVVGFAGAMIASTVAAVVAFAVVRRLGRNAVQPYLNRPVFRAIEARLARRGWLAVGSLRFIAVCPFAVCNYCSALSSVRPVPYTVASVVGMAPGTAAVVFLGDALSGEAHPATLLLSAALFATGLLGLFLDSRLPVRQAA